MIQVEHLVKKYGKRTAVDDLSFNVEKGQIYGFLGPNGAGKSTTMNIMTGYIAATGGSVRICGYDILKDPLRAKRCIGYLPEIPPLYADMTVWEYLMFAAGLKKIPRKERYERVDEVIERIKLSEVSERLIRNLSKGFKQRVGLAQALLADPEVLILDEPMVGMDPRQIIEMRDLLKELSVNHTILLSSHILSEIRAVCDHIMIISHGQLAASGSPEELQEMLQSKAELELTVCAEQEAVEELLAKMEELETYSFAPGDIPENLCVTIIEKPQQDIRKELSVRLAGAGIPILSMNRKEHSLEDIFLELTDADSESVDLEEVPSEADDDSESEVTPEQDIEEISDCEYAEKEEEEHGSNI